MNDHVRLIAKVIAQPLRAKIRHYRSLPPHLTSGEDLREQMASATILVIETKPDGIFLVRFALNGEIVGDTWHQTIEEAQEQAAFEYGSSLSAWAAVPADVTDLFTFSAGS
jgi:hypothetical protein